jgi:hypothetical protein
MFPRLRVLWAVFIGLFLPRLAPAARPEVLQVYWWDAEAIRKRTTIDPEANSFDWYFFAPGGAFVPWDSAFITRRQDGRTGAWLPTDPANPDGAYGPAVLHVSC